MANGRVTPKKPPPVRAITYERISLDRTGEEAGVTRQRQDNTAYCDRQGWTIVADIVDDDISASRYSHKKRKGYLEAIRMIINDEADAIVAYHLDRLWRRPDELEQLIDLVEERNVIVATLTGKIDLMTGDGRYMARSLVNVAAMESDNISRRTARGWAYDREQGLPSVRRGFFGWSDPTTPNPAEAAWIVEAVDAVLGGESIRSVARHWNRVKVPHPGGADVKPWGSTQVSRILANPHHAGLVSYRRKVKGKDGKWRYRREVVGEGTWEPIIDRERFERLTAILDANKAKVAGQTPRRRRFLTGFLVCGKCGNTLTRGGPPRGPERNWRCYEKESFPDACNALSINAHHLEKLVRDTVLELVAELHPADLVSDGEADKRTGVMLELANLERKDKELSLLWSRSKISAAAWESASQDLEAQQAALRSRLAKTSRRSVLVPYAGNPGALEEAWDSDRLSVDQQRAIVAATVGKITIAERVNGAARRFDPDRVIFGDPKKLTRSPDRVAFLTVTEAAHEAGISRDAMWSRIHRRRHGTAPETVVPPFQQRFGQWMVAKEDLDRWMRDLGIDPASRTGVLTVKEAAARAGVTGECLLWRQRMGKSAPAFRKGPSGHWVVTVDEFERWLANENANVGTFPLNGRKPANKVAAG